MTYLFSFRSMFIHFVFNSFRPFVLDVLLASRFRFDFATTTIYPTSFDIIEHSSLNIVHAPITRLNLNIH